MIKSQVLSFNAAYSYEPSPEENQLGGDMLAVWGKLEPAAAKNPALIRKGIIFGMGLAAALEAGEIVAPPVRAKRPGKKQPGQRSGRSSCRNPV